MAKNCLGIQSVQIGRLIGIWATFQSLWQQLVCSNFCKGVQIYHFSGEIIFGQLLLTFGNFLLTGHTVWDAQLMNYEYYSAKKSMIFCCVALSSQEALFRYLEGTPPTPLFIRHSFISLCERACNIICKRQENSFTLSVVTRRWFEKMYFISFKCDYFQHSKSLYQT